MHWIKKIVKEILDIYMFLRIAVLSKIYKNKIYIFGTPIHGNIGDQAIIIAEREFIKDNFPKLRVIEIESNILMKFINKLTRVIGNTTILISGGGFLGSLWMNEEEMFRTTLTNFEDNKIIVLPQTVYFSSDDAGKKVLNESKKIYESHKNLYICCREQYSYDFMKKEMPTCNILLVPDMVLYLNKLDKMEKKDILFCIRQDKEKVQYDLSKIEKQLGDKYHIEYTDTVLPKKVYSYNRIKILSSKLKQFGTHKLVITDRLHGMIFALLAQTPCLVLENKSYKIKGVYNWIKESNYIKLINIEELYKFDIESFINIKECLYDRKDNIRHYKVLIDLINMEK